MYRTGRRRARRYLSSLPDHKICQVIGYCGYNVLVGVVDTREKTDEEMTDMFEDELLRMGKAQYTQGQPRHGWLDQCTEVVRARSDEGLWITPSQSLNIIRREFNIPPPPGPPTYILEIQNDKGSNWIVILSASGQRLVEMKVDNELLRKNAVDKLEAIRKKIGEEEGTINFHLFTEHGLEVTPEWLHDQLSDVRQRTNIRESYFEGGYRKQGRIRSRGVRKRHTRKGRLAKNTRRKKGKV